MRASGEGTAAAPVTANEAPAASAGAAAGPARPSPGHRDRVPGWDLLRGLCALAVMSYHLLGWQEIAHLSPLGTYGVYLFFLLSGASMAYVYDADRVGRWGGAWRFLVTRWFRLAPLYLLACLAFLALLAARNGQWASEIPLRLALNASFAFGLHDPTTWALAVGGWSLGVEFVFYLAFPFLMQAGRTWPGRWATLAALVLLQAAWVDATVGREGFDAAITAYHQVPAFGAWFFAGCVIGQARREGGVMQAPPWFPGGPVLADGAHDAVPRGLSMWGGVAVWALLGLLLVAANTPIAGAELVGWRGVLLPLACAGAVWVSGQVRVQGARALAMADLLGRLTYGSYLIHPLVFFGLTWFVWPGAQDAAAASTPTGLAIALGAGLATCVLATQGYRFIEAPGQRLASRLLQRRGSSS